MFGFLDGICVIDFIVVVFGLLVMLLFVDQGVDVIKVELMVVGDFM